jgi:hypothetical protein
MQGDVAFQLEGPDKEIACRHEHHATAVGVASVDGTLDGRSIERMTIAPGAIFQDVVGAVGAGLGW